jgi:hypothetical protein
VLIQLFPPDDERLSLETCRGGKIKIEKSEKSASSWLKTHKDISIIQPQNTNTRCCMWFSKQNIIQIYKNEQNAMKTKNFMPCRIFL